MREDILKWVKDVDPRIITVADIPESILDGASEMEDDFILPMMVLYFKFLSMTEESDEVIMTEDGLESLLEKIQLMCGVEGLKRKGVIEIYKYPLFFDFEGSIGFKKGRYWDLAQKKLKSIKKGRRSNKR